MKTWCKLSFKWKETFIYVSYKWRYLMDLSFNQQIDEKNHMSYLFLYVQWVEMRGGSFRIVDICGIVDHRLPFIINWTNVTERSIYIYYLFANISRSCKIYQQFENYHLSSQLIEHIKINMTYDFFHLSSWQEQTSLQTMNRVGK
jgi:hypothetical protein